MSDTSLADLHSRPGFLIRRAHQISTSVFMEETAALNVTTTQYGLLYLIKHFPDIDQVSASQMLGLDRSTAAMVLRSLEKSGMIVRSVASDKRRRALTLTGEGEALLRNLDEPAARALKRLLSPLDPAEAAMLVYLLKKLTAAFNESARVPLMYEQAEDDAGKETAESRTPPAR
jgi:DNA-binding MarR family transcriptional regulator